MATMGYVHITGTSGSVKQVKLQQDVASLNSAVKAYLMSGGDIPSNASASAVLAKLKTTSAAAQRSQMVGLRGTMVDLRLQGIASTGNGYPRAVWDNSRQSFTVADTGSGFREFALNDAAIPANLTEETRKISLAMDSRDNWIWGFQSGGTSASSPTNTAATSAANVILATGGGALSVLSAPAYSRPGALYGFNEFTPTMPISLIDNNPANTAQMYYSIDNGDWIPYDGNPLSIPRRLDVDVRAYSAPLDPDRYEQSAVSAEHYETIYFDGSSTGWFANRAGPSGMKTNLPTYTSTNPVFTWGDPATSLGFTQPNKLTFVGTPSIGTVGPDTLFELGTLSYYNGTTWVGSTADTVNLKINIVFNTLNTSQALSFPLQLISTPNWKNDGNSSTDPGNTMTSLQLDNHDADYVKINSVSTAFNGTLKGQVWYLQLSFGANDSNGFTTIDQFHTHENKTMTGKIYGKFTTTPSAL